MANRAIKLEALRRARALGEREALELKLRIDSITEERRSKLEAVLEDYRELCLRISELGRESFNVALSSSSCGDLIAADAYRRRLLAERRKVLRRLDRRKAELESAVERGRVADEELLEKKIESKTVERIISRRRYESDLLSEVEHELEVEGLSRPKN